MARMTPISVRLASPQMPVSSRRWRRALVALVAPLVALACLVAMGPAASASTDQAATSTGQATTSPSGEATVPSPGYSGVDGPHQDDGEEQTGQDVSTTEVVLIGLIVVAALALVVTLVIRRRRQIRG